MIKHMVLFKLKDEVPPKEKIRLTAKFKEAIENLPTKIPGIRKIEVGFNTNPDEKWQIALYSEFDTLEDVKRYVVHPEHIAAGKIIAEIKESRACVDYQL
ncbi:hypothetical protein EZS27_031504 [termite gut metagenome]|uniref:Stress-response A/B barrel domain-containing protein n=1 Tax=termite gut metagenome TaxID=433724 RepID=A0A5J4QC10_9ZZZZ